MFFFVPNALVYVNIYERRKLMGAGQWTPNNGSDIYIVYTYIINRWNFKLKSVRRLLFLYAIAILEHLMPNAKRKW